MLYVFGGLPPGSQDPSAPTKLHHNQKIDVCNPNSKDDDMAMCLQK